MATAVFSVIYAGPQVSVQDGGRKGLLRFGVPASGPMDRTGFASANVALGNAADRSAIEVSLGGLVLDCTDGQVSFGMAGGAFQVSLGSARYGSWTVATISAGTRLTVRAGDRGSWTYIAFAGLIRAPLWLGSAATHALSGLGGGTLTQGGRIFIDDAQVREEREGDIPLPPASPAGPIRVVLGPQDRFFAPDTITAFLAHPFLLTDAYDRMGVRLSGVRLRLTTAPDMPSEAIVRGSVQLAGDGVATVLLADHQTTGGYPKIATVITADLDRFAQLRSGDTVMFQAISPQEALILLRKQHAVQADYLSAIRLVRGSLTQRLNSRNLIDGVVSGTDI